MPTIDQARTTVVVNYVWRLDGMPPLEQRDEYTGRRTTIDPRQITITANPSRVRRGLYVHIEGRTIRRDGQPGQTRRGIAFMDGPRSPEQDMSLLPPQYLPYLDAVRDAEASRNTGV